MTLCMFVFCCTTYLQYRIEKIAQKIVEDIQGPLVVMCVLKGGQQVFADLVNYIRRLNSSARMYYML